MRSFVTSLLVPQECNDFIVNEFVNAIVIYQLSHKIWATKWIYVRIISNSRPLNSSRNVEIFAQHIWICQVTIPKSGIEHFGKLRQLIVKEKAIFWILDTIVSSIGLITGSAALIGTLSFDEEKREAVIVILNGA